MYRIGLETILGFTKHGETLTLEPCVPRAWKSFSLEYRYASSTYAVTVTRVGDEQDVLRVAVDGADRGDLTIQLVDDGQRHDVVVEIG
jgi:cyclic beta-1,2-glucan synthetase